MIKVTHIHPMLVHFPIVLFLVAVALICYAQVKNENIAARNCIGNLVAWSLIMATVFALIAAVFGDIALDAALDKGFPKAPLEEHESLAAATIAVLSILSLTLIAAIWKRIDLAGTRGKLFLAVALVSLGLLIATAYHGGALVYDLGVNVEGVVPKQL